VDGCGYGVEPDGGLFVEAIHQVPVAVHRDLDRGVAESGLDGLGVFAFCDEPCGVGVTQIVYSARRPD
jgi:hypothetical protein